MYYFYNINLKQTVMKTYKLQFGKANEISYNEIRRMQKAGDLTISCSISQVLKRLTYAMFCDIIEDLNSGISVTIEG